MPGHTAFLPKLLAAALLAAASLLAPGAADAQAVIQLGSGFARPAAVAVDSSGNVFVADATRNEIMEIPVGGGPPVQIGAAEGNFSTPLGLAVDAAGNVFVADSNNGTIEEITAADGYVTVKTLIPNRTLGSPSGVAVDADGNIFIANLLHPAAVYEALAADNYATIVSLGSGWQNPEGIALDPAGNVFVSDPSDPNNAIKEIVASSGYQTIKGLTTSGSVGQLAIDAQGNLYTTVPPSGIVIKITPDGGTPPQGGSFDFKEPFGIAADQHGNIYVATELASQIAEIEAATTTTLGVSPSPGALGGAVTLTATITGSAGSPSGTVTFFDGGIPLGQGTVSAGVASLTTHTLSVGTHSLTASYSGDLTFAPSTSTAQPETVNPAATATTLTSSANPSAPGQSVFFTASVSAVGGAVTFQIDSLPPLTVNLVGGQASCSTAALATGNHSIIATYGGTADFASSTAALTQTVELGASTTSLISSADPSTAGQAVTFTAFVNAPNGVPSGTVNFLDGTSTIGSFTLANGVASFTTSSLSVASHSITASYGGDNNFATSTSSAVTQTVNAAPLLATQTALVAAPNPSAPGQAVTFTATVTGNGNPSGSVTFKDGAAPLGTVTLVNGVASFSTSSLATGNHPITASYGGDGTFATSGSPVVTEAVNQLASTTTLAAAPNPSASGQIVTITAIVTGSGNPSGSVTFKDGTVPLGTVTLVNGVASFSTSALAVGSHSISASYGGDSIFIASTSSILSLTVTAAPAHATTTVLSASADPSLAGQSVTFSAVVTGSNSPTGSVSFYDGATSLGTGTLASGLAKLATASLAVGNHQITAVYGGDGTSSGSFSAPLTQVVEANSTSGQVYGYQNTLGVTGIAVADTAHFSSPVPGAVDAAGHHLFVADTGNHRVQVLDTETLAVVATIGVAGEAGSDNLHLDHPGGVAFDASSRHLFVVDTANQRIQIFSADNFSYLATFGATGTAGSGEVSFNQPSNAFASTVTNQLYVADTGNHRVLAFSLSGLGLTATLGTSGVAGSDNAHFDQPVDAEFDPSTNQILVADTGNRRVQVFDATNFAYVMTLGTTGIAGGDNAHFAQPMSAAFDPASNLVLVADGGANARVQVFDGMSYQYVLTLGTVGAAGPGNSQFASPQGITADAAHSRLFIGDGANDRVQVFAIAPIVTEASVLPGSRSVQLGSPATVFASVVNAGTTALDGCRIALPVSAPAGLSLDYQTTDPATNALTGRPDTPATIPGAGGVQSFLVTLRSSATLATTTLPLDFDCSGAAPATVVTGLDTVDLSVASTPVPDIIALAATASGNGIVQTTPGIAGPFAVASANVGATAPITVSADTGSAQLFVQLLLCQTNPSTGQCLATPSSSTTLNFAAGATPTFSVFIEASGVVPLDPANNRVFVRFKDGNGALRGSTSVAFAALPG